MIHLSERFNEISSGPELSASIGELVKLVELVCLESRRGHLNEDLLFSHWSLFSQVFTKVLYHYSLTKFLSH